MTKHTLEELSEQWNALPRVTKADQQKAETFYRAHILPLVLDRVISRQKGLLPEGHDLLISALGTSPEPLILTISLLQPRRVMFLCSPHTEHLIEVIRQHTGLELHSLHKAYVEKDDALPIYEEVHKAVQEQARRLGHMPRLAIDMTGGTKLMGAGCAMAGVLLGADIFYVAGEFDPNHRRPVPGTEKVVKFQDPYAEFGHLQADQALARFARHDYAGAAQIFEEVAQKVARPRTYECLSLLSRAYEAWDALRLDQALDKMQRVCGMVRRFRTDSPLMNSLQVETLDFQLQALQRLNSALIGSKITLAFLQDSDAFSPLLFSIVEAALRNEEKESYESASLLLYRAIEMMAQRRLALRNINTSDVDYSALEIDPVQDVARMQEQLKLPRPLSSPLPAQVPLFIAHVLLAWVKDGYMTASAPIDLGRLSHQIQARNEGLYAHGFRPTDKAAFSKFKDFAFRCLDCLCEAEGWDASRMRAQCQFVRLPLTSTTVAQSG